MGYWDYIGQLAVDDLTRDLLKLILMSVLEDVSYTRKDGQYLRWDSRSSKARQRDEDRLAKGRERYRPFHKRQIMEARTALLAALDRVESDITSVQHESVPASEQKLIAASVLDVLPSFEANQFHAVITSPPYCNRYDYTRTYALELAFLGLTHEAVVRLRQEQLSCTIENRSKLAHLASIYETLGRGDDYGLVVDTIESNAALQEVFRALRLRAARGELNNRGVVQMVEGYFTELAFVLFELRRVTRPGAFVAFVNDNVRYGGEIIPVDLLMTDLGASFCLRPKVVYSLEQQKGNSSQQMGKFGRAALRKSITIWQKQ
jgi:site-specific DNA-methyltransferase (cytosine-N4-specific)